MLSFQQRQVMVLCSINGAKGVEGEERGADQKQRQLRASETEEEAKGRMSSLSWDLSEREVKTDKASP